MLVFALLWLWLSPAMASQETLRQFQLKQCHQNLCIELITQKALRSNLENIFVFAKAQLKTFKRDEKGMHASQTLEAKDGYYDPVAERIIVRGLQGENSEAIYNMTNGHFLFFKD